MVNGQLVEKYKTEQEEMRHNYEEKMRALHEEKVYTFYYLLRFTSLQNAFIYSYLRLKQL